MIYQADSQRKLPTVASTNVHSTTSATTASARPSLSSSAAMSRVLPTANDETTLTAPPSSATTSTTSTTSTAQARLIAAALVSQSVRKSADFNNSGDHYTNTSITDGYPDVSRNRGSLADYSASASASGGAHPTSTNKRSSFAGTPTSRSEFILSINPPPTFTMSTGATAPSNVIAGRGGGGCEPMIMESNHGSLASLAAHRDSLTSSKGSLYSDDRSPSDQVTIHHYFYHIIHNFESNI